MVLVEYNPPDSSCLTIWNADMLMGLSGSIIVLNTPQALPMLSRTILQPKPPLINPHILISVYPSPLREGFYTIWVALVERGIKGVISSYRYDLTLLDPMRLTLRQKTSQRYNLSRPWVHRLQFTTISYAGYAVVASCCRDRPNVNILGLSCPASTSRFRTKTPLMVELVPQDLSQAVRKQPIPNYFSFISPAIIFF